MSPISRGGLSCVADETGAIPPMSLLLSPSALLDESGGGGSRGGAVLLVLRTWPGVPAPSGPIDMQLLDADGNDCFYGGGRGRSHTRKQSSILRAGRDDLHCIIFDGEQVTLYVSGNTRPGAVVWIELTYGLHDAKEDARGGLCH